MNFIPTKPKQRAGVLRLGAALLIVAGLSAAANEAHAAVLYSQSDISTQSDFRTRDAFIQRRFVLTSNLVIPANSYFTYKTSAGSCPGAALQFYDSPFNSGSLVGQFNASASYDAGNETCTYGNGAGNFTLLSGQNYDILMPNEGDGVALYGSPDILWNGSFGEGQSSGGWTVDYDDPFVGSLGFTVCDSSPCEIPPFISDTTTRVISTVPAGGSVNATSTSFVFTIDGYLNADDLNSGSEVVFRVHNLYTAQSFLVGPLFSGLFGSPFPTEGQEPFDETYSTSLIELGDFEVNKVASVLGIGEYFMDVTIRKSSGFLGLFHDTLFATSTSFLVATSTTFGEFQEIISNSVSSTTQALANGIDACSWTGNFDFFGCLYSLAVVLFIPDTAGLNNMFDTMKQEVLYSFPLGYVTDFIDIMSTSTVGTLTVLDLHTPAALGFGSNHMRLDLAHSLDWILYSTSTIFSSAESTTTQNFYQVTSYYWRIILYVLAGFYIIGRILGSHVIPTMGGFGSRGALSDTSSSDDSYRLKEKLYNMSKRK